MTSKTTTQVKEFTNKQTGKFSPGARSLGNAAFASQGGLSGVFGKAIEAGIASGLFKRVGSSAADTRVGYQTSINARNLNRLNKARLDRNAMIAKQGAGLNVKPKTRQHKEALQQSLYKSKLGSVV